MPHGLALKDSKSYLTTKRAFYGKVKQRIRLKIVDKTYFVLPNIALQTQYLLLKWKFKNNLQLLPKITKAAHVNFTNI